MLRKATFLALLAYLGALAATQTAVGGGFGTLRWVALVVMFVLGTLEWVATWRSSSLPWSAAPRVGVYLAIWGATVITAEYPLFSAYRWMAHAMLVLFGLVYLPRLLRVEDTQWLVRYLKAVLGVVLVASQVAPAGLTVNDVAEMQRGIFGNANSLGHMAAAGGLIFLHGSLTSRQTYWRWIQGALAAFAVLMMVRSGARSSTVAFSAGILTLYVLYRAQIYRYASIAFVAVIALLLSIQDFAQVSSSVSGFVFKHAGELPQGSSFDRINYSRVTPLESHIKGFSERPFLGWGFGLDRDADLSNWNGELTALGYTTRDPVNDVMYTLESGGILGLLAYLFILSVAVRAWMPLATRETLRARIESTGDDRLRSVLDVHEMFVCLTVMLIVLFQMDNTALAAGNFFAALLWIGMGVALGLTGRLQGWDTAGSSRCVEL